MRGSKQKTILLGLMVVFLILIAEIANAQPAGSSSGSSGGWSLTGSVAEMFLYAIATVLYWIFVLMGKVASAALAFLDFMLKPDLYQLLTIGAVSKAWTVVRDFINLFFVLILLFVAICTILRIEEYSAKKMLIKVLSAAVLINFSKPISLVFIDTSQLLMNFFSNNIKGVLNGRDYSAVLADYIGLEKVFDISTTMTPPPTSGSVPIGYVIGMILSIVFMFILAAMVFTIALSLVYRIVGFMVLIILSPMAFAGAAMPGTPLHGAYKKWMDKMIGWAFYGPALFFFLWLSLIILMDLLGGTGSTGNSIFTPLNTDISKLFTIPGMEGVAAGILKQIIPFAVALYLLFYGYDMAKGLASQAGKSVSGLLDNSEKKIKKWSKRTGYAAAGAAGIVGTAGVGVLGYKWMRDRGGPTAAYNSVKGGLKKKFQGDDDDKKDKAARTEARLAGGDHWEKYSRTKAMEMAKKWDDVKPTDKELEKKRKSKDEIERKAAALFDAKEGNFKKVDDFKGAMDAAGKDDKLKKKIREDAEKRNLKQVLEYDAQYDTQAAIDRLVKKKEEEEKAAGRAWNDTTKKAEVTRIKGLSAAVFRQEIFDEKLPKLTLDKMGDQNLDFHNAPEFAKYMNDNTGAGKKYTKGQLKGFAAKKLNGAKNTAWTTNGISV